MNKQDDFDEKDLTEWTTYDPKKDNPNLVFTAKSDKPEVLIVGYLDESIGWGSVLFVLSAVLVAGALWVLFHLSKAMEVIPWMQ